METLYRKVGKRYVETGYGGIPDLHDGIWLVQKHPHSKSTSSLLWKVGELKRPVDIATKASVLALQQDLVDYLLNLTKEDTEEYKALKEKLGGWMKGVPCFVNISVSDFADAVLNHISDHFEKITN